SLGYSWTWGDSQEAQSAGYAVGLTATRPRFGGLRWWFVCPLVVGGVPCGRRGQAVPAAAGPLLRLPDLPRPDLHQLPGEPQVRPLVPRGRPTAGDRRRGRLPPAVQARVVASPPGSPGARRDSGPGIAGVE